MSYNPLTDFLGLLRQDSAGIEFERMPGLDYVISALARAGVIALSVGQTAPTTNQVSTVWFRPSVPSWVAEGTVFLWNVATGAYEPATPALWNALFTPPGGYSFQSVAGATGVVTLGTSLLAIQRASPVLTQLTLPNLQKQWATGRALQIVDFSTALAAAGHVIKLTTPDGATIMQQSLWQLLSNVDQLSGVTLQPSPNLNAWVIAP